MVKRLLIAIFVLSACPLTGQTVVQYADTFRAVSYVAQDDDYLLRMLEAQGRALAAQEDSALQARMLTDTTTAFPFHVGVRDSLRIARQAQRMARYYPLALPQVFMPAAALSFRQKPDSVVTSYSIREGARRYMAAHETGLYACVYDSLVEQELLQNDAQMSQLLRPMVPALVPDAEEDRQEALRRLRQKKSNWYKEGTVMLQLTQNYVSPNWYQGGNSNFALLGIAQGKILYDNHKNITWENTGEWRLGFNTVKGDSLRKVNANEDVFKLYSKFGVKIVEKLSWSLSGEFQTHFFNTWKDNTKELKTGPLTPARLNLATGLDYKPVTGLSIYFAPLTYKLVAALDTLHAAQTAYSIPSGQKVLNDLGSSLRVEWHWKPVREIELDSKFYLYTNYRRVEIDWETTCNFLINRYLSARIMLHPRYDNSVILPSDERAHLQFKELISIGFAHKFH